jgi:hypothetical protein
MTTTLSEIDATPLGIAAARANGSWHEMPTIVPSDGREYSPVGVVGEIDAIRDMLKHAIADIRTPPPVIRHHHQQQQQQQEEEEKVVKEEIAKEAAIVDDDRDSSQHHHHSTRHHHRHRRHHSYDNEVTIAAVYSGSGGSLNRDMLCIRLDAILERLNVLSVSAYATMSKLARAGSIWTTNPEMNGQGQLLRASEPPAWARQDHGTGKNTGTAAGSGNAAANARKKKKRQTLPLPAEQQQQAAASTSSTLTTEQQQTVAVLSILAEKPPIPPDTTEKRTVGNGGR